VLDGSHNQLFFETYPGIVLHAMKINTIDLDSGGSLNHEADIIGRVFEDFRNGSVAAHRNPVVIAYDILTSEWPWGIGIDPSHIDVSQWRTYANWCDDVINAQARFTFNGVISEKDPFKAAQYVLSHAHLSISDTGKMLRIISNGDEASVLTVEMSDFFSSPNLVMAEPGTILSDVEVFYHAQSDESDHSVYYSKAVTPDLFSKASHRMNGFIHPWEAYRWAYQRQKLSEEVWSITCKVGPIVADCIPGNVITMYITPFGEYKDVRILSINATQELGVYVIRGRIIAGSVVCPDHVDDDGDGIIDPGWETGTPNPPQNVNLTVHVHRTSNDTEEPIVKISWNPPNKGPRVQYYEVRYGAYILAHVSALKWSGQAPSDGNIKLTVASVGIDGTQSAGVDSNLVDASLGMTTGAYGVQYSGAITGDAGQYAFDDVNDTLNPLKFDYIINYLTDIIRDGDDHVSFSSIPVIGDIVAAVAIVHGPSSPIVPLSVMYSPTSIEVYRDGTTGDLPVTVMYIHASTSLDMGNAG